jgi:hypothetical protein
VAGKFDPAEIVVELSSTEESEAVDYLSYVVVVVVVVAAEVQVASTECYQSRKDCSCPAVLGTVVVVVVLD